jgi:hypothetical protein
MDAPADPDPYVTVLAVEPDGEADLHRGAGHG